MFELPQYDDERDRENTSMLIRDIRRVTDLYNAFGDRFSVFCGVDDLILESLALGVTGWVSGMTNA